MSLSTFFAPFQEAQLEKRNNSIRIATDASLLTRPLTETGAIISNIIKNFPHEGPFRFQLYAAGEWHPDFNDIIDLPHVDWFPLRQSNRYPLLWFCLLLPRRLFQKGAELYWGANQLIPPALPQKLPVALTINNLLLYTPFSFAMKRKERKIRQLLQFYSMRRASILLSTSKATSQKLQKLFPDAAGKTKVISPGASLRKSMPKRDSSERGSSERKRVQTDLEKILQRPLAKGFILSVSDLEPHKNYGTLLDAYLLYHRAHRGLAHEPLPLVIAGERGREGALFYRKLDQYSRESGNIHLLENRSALFLEQLYKSCTFFCMPSYYEDFSLPLLQALIYRKFVIASNLLSFQEVGGTIIRYEKPDDPIGWSVALMEISDIYRKGNSLKVGFAAENFLWKDCARSYQEVFFSLLSSG